jgi:hypothetical protein
VGPNPVSLKANKCFPVWPPKQTHRVRKNAGSLWLFSEGVQVAAAQTVTLGPRIGPPPFPSNGGGPHVTDGFRSSGEP